MPRGRRNKLTRELERLRAEATGWKTPANGQAV
jgi:hypothetical protein